MALLLAPFLVQAFVPSFPNAIVPIAVVLCSAAFFVRMYLGCCYIAANHCGTVLRHVQCATLLLGLLALMMIDALLMAVQGVPGRPIWRDPNEFPVLIAIYAFYIVCMSITLYPGSSNATTDELDAMPSPNGG